jgi:hypothetical protein
LWNAGAQPADDLIPAKAAEKLLSVPTGGSVGRFRLRFACGVGQLLLDLLQGQLVSRPIARNT